MFTLDDQFGRAHGSTDVFADRPVLILAGAQRTAPDAMQAWERALHGRLPAGARVFGLSNLKRLPFFVPKGVVTKGLVGQLPKLPILCDWKGKVYPALGFPDGAVISAGVFDASGNSLGVVTGEPNEARVQKVVELLSR